MRLALLLLSVMALAGCSGSLGVGGDDGVGVKSTVVKDGKIISMEPTNGDGKPRQ